MVFLVERSLMHEGLRQGGPISPLLLVVAVDALTTMDLRAAEEGARHPNTSLGIQFTNLYNVAQHKNVTFASVLGATP